jgi:glutathione S-transferase
MLVSPANNVSRGLGMLTLYYTPGACSIAAHIVLEESGEKYEAKKVDLAGGEQRSEAYLKINPLGRVPALVLDNCEPLAENTAILPFLGKRFGLWPEDALAEAKALSLIGFFASSVHVAFAHVSRPERYASDSTAFPTLKDTGLKAFHGYVQQIDGMLAELTGSPITTPCSIPMASSFTRGVCAASSRWESSRTTRRSRTGCSNDPLSDEWWTANRSRCEQAALAFAARRAAA